MISAEMAADVEVLATELQLERWSPLVWPSEFADDETQCVSWDASTPLRLGWVAHAFGALACGVWATSTRKLIQSWRLSINPLELLASTVAVLLLEEKGLIPGHRQMSLRGENTTACNETNTGIAYSPAMRLALSIFVCLCRQAQVGYWLYMLARSAIESLISRAWRTKLTSSSK